MVNETNSLVSYRQAALWVGDASARGGRGKIMALSGLAQPAGDSAFNVWLSDLLEHHAGETATGEPRTVSPRPDTDDMRMWRDYLPKNGLWIPLPLQPGTGDAEEPSKKPPLQAGLVLWRDQEWTRQEAAVLALLGGAYAHAWRALGKNTRTWFGEGGFKATLARLRTKRWRLVILLVLLAAMFFPVRQSVLAPAEIVPRDPFTVRAPLRGVVERITVQPNDTVRKGDLLVRIDAREIEGKLESARQSLAVANAELRQKQQQALFDEKSKSALGILQSRRDQAASDAAYFESMLQRTEIRAERPGIAVFDDPQEWSGRPVTIGERIMVIADPRDVEMEAHIPLADAIALRAGTQVRLFMNAEPASPLEATLERVGYRAVPVADGTLAYRARAAFAPRPEDSGPELRVGLKGTAKLYGEPTFFVVYLLRKPLTRLRLWLNL